MRGFCWSIILVINCWQIEGKICPAQCECANTWMQQVIFCPSTTNYGIKLTVDPEKTLVECSKEAIFHHFDLLDLESLDGYPSITFKGCPPTATGLRNIPLIRKSPLNLTSYIFESQKQLSLQLFSTYLAGLDNLSELGLSFNKINFSLHDNLNFPSLTRLNLSNNLISDIPKSIFSSIPKLNSLDLSNNIIAQLNYGIFSELNNLTFLNLSHNKIYSFTGNEFVLTSLNNLDLRFNQLQNLPLNVFDHLINLEYLNLSGNNISQLSEGLFQKTKSLKIVNVNDNRNNLILPGKCFEKLEQLNEINLMRSGISKLPPDIFFNSHNIKIISLNGNLLEELPSGLFDWLINLLVLDLSFNQLTYLPSYIFTYLENLRTLNLGNNRLTSVSDNHFLSFHNLEYLNIENNELSKVPTFTQLVNLRVAHFSNNKLDLVTDYESERISQLSHSHHLNKLFIANNSISEIFLDWRIIMYNLTILDLSYNLLTTLTSDDFKFSSTNLTVDLRHNKIQQIVIDETETIAENQEIKPANVRILLADNPLNCNCTAYDLWKYSKNQSKLVVSLDLERLVCAEPAEIGKRPFTSLTSAELTCMVTEDCPASCECWYRPVDSALVVNCSSRNLIKVPEILPCEPYSNHIELLLQNNLLTTLPRVLPPSYGNVKHLNLSHNRLTSLEPDIFTDRLSALDADYNYFTHMPGSVLKKLSKNDLTLNRVTFNGNPWICDCANSEFVDWIQTHSKMASLLGDIKCSDNRVLNKLSASDLCSSHFIKRLAKLTPENVFFYAHLIIAFAVCAMIAALYYRYQRYIRVSMYSHTCCLWLARKQAKIYYAFITFRHEENDFVKKQLVPQLEASGLSLCVHYRDCFAEEHLPDQIANSLESCRRTLKSNSLDSVRGHQELRTAHQPPLSEGWARVVIVLYDDMPTDQLAELKENNYYKRRDPYFWEKLLHALPHLPKALKLNKKERFLNKIEIIGTSLTTTNETTTPPAVVINQPNLAKNPDKNRNDFSSIAIC